MFDGRRNKKKLPIGQMESLLLGKHSNGVKKSFGIIGKTRNILMKWIMSTMEYFVAIIAYIKHRIK